MAVLGNVGHAGAADEMREVQTAAKALGIEVDKLEIRRAEDIAAAFERLASGAQALYVCPDPLVNSTAFASASWRSACGCRPYSGFGNTSIRQA